MITTRRNFLVGAATAAALGPRPLLAEQAVTYPTGEPRPDYVPDPRYMPQPVSIKEGFTPGEIHIDSAFYFLYLVGEENTAMRYGVAVGAAGRSFSGEAVIERKAIWPTWTPTQEMIARNPDFYAPFKDGYPGGPTNPLGARALYLYQNGKDTLYRIHGTPEPWTIGRSVSSGCIRMVNAHVVDLYDRVDIGTRVIVYPQA